MHYRLPVFVIAMTLGEKMYGVSVMYLNNWYLEIC